MTEEKNPPATLRMSDELANRVKGYMEKNGIKIRHKALLQILEKGLDAEFSNSSMTIEKGVPGDTVQSLQVLLSLKLLEMNTNNQDITAISKEEVNEIIELLNKIDTILHNLNFYSEALKAENFIALHDMAKLAKEIM